LGAHLVFLDESGFLLIPNLKRTWSPRGQTPHARYWYKQGHISSISALSVSPRQRHLALYLDLQNRSFNGLDVLRFLRYLLRHLRGPVVLLWDRGPIHRRGEVQAFLVRHPRVHPEYFPAYAPELNPAEFVWCQSDSRLANGFPANVAELRQSLQSAIRRIRRSQQLLWSCIYASDLPWTQ
jgi:transposase